MQADSGASSRPPGLRPVRLDSIRNPQPRPPLASPGQPAAKKKRSDRILVCTVPSCQSSNLEEENGDLICQACGSVLMEGNIVSDNTFIETGGGESLRAGVTVGNDATRPRVYDAMAARIAGGMTSREVSEANGRHSIRAVAGHPLNISSDLQDAAMQIYKLALVNNFVQGRLTRSVAAMNVFKLGNTFKALMSVLSLGNDIFRSLEPINIESLILRFAEQMNFGRMKQRIANEAVRIVQRMSRDWMAEGRRPAGICGAALILAARMNNFRRVVREVVYTVKVAEITIKKRLDEFKETASSGLTIEQFRTTDLESAEDPPAFKNRDKAKKIKKKRGRSRTSRDADNEDTPDDRSQRSASATPSNTNGQLETPSQTQAELDRQIMPPPPVPIDPALLHVTNERLAELQTASASPASSPTAPKRGRGRPRGKTQAPTEPSTSDLQAEAEIEAEIQTYLHDQTNVENARAIHENPDAPGIP
ncbi:MAG: hypothetical protein Q9222_007394, partial [Ikaeria aurantiellina]